MFIKFNNGGTVIIDSDCIICAVPRPVPDGKSGSEITVMVGDTEKALFVEETPDEVYDNKLTMRQASSMLSTALCRKWWGIDTSKDEFVEMAENLRIQHDKTWKDSFDRVLDSIESEPKTIKQIIDSTKLKKREVIEALHKIRATRETTEDNDIVWKI